ncbi:hypothetical protein NCHU2750_24220 [Neorhizobium sp. NCHU2750]|nr:hypothetical protein NCHU2750_24220 [Neorhizobium sp. NCHU2750]
MRGGEWAGIETTDMRAPPDFPLHKAGTFQHLDMLGSRRKRHGMRFGQLPDGALSRRQFSQHPATRGVAQGVESSVYPMCVKFNHVV